MGFLTFTRQNYPNLAVDGKIFPAGIIQSSTSSGSEMEPSSPTSFTAGFIFLIYYMYISELLGVGKCLLCYQTRL